MSKHTPGPWRELPDLNGWIRIGHPHCSVATVFNPLVGEQLANANLIAAAPDAYAAAKIAIVELDAVERKIGVPSKALPMLRAFIAKAEGTS